MPVKRVSKKVKKGPRAVRKTTKGKRVVKKRIKGKRGSVRSTAMACFGHPKGQFLSVPAKSEVVLEREHDNELDVVRAYYWGACENAADHVTATTNDAMMSIRKKLRQGQSFKSIGVCCEVSGRRMALYVWPGTKAAFEP